MKNKINKLLANSLKNTEFPTDESFGMYKKSKYNNNKEYQSSFEEIKKWSSKISDEKKKKLNCIIFNNKNADGILSAYVVIKYLKIKLKKEITEDDVFLMPIGASSGRGIDRNLLRKENKLKNKHIIVVDLAYNKESLDFLKKVSKHLIVIDDHPLTKKIINNTKLNNKNYYIGNLEHAACGYTWKFFFPKKKSFTINPNNRFW